MIVETDLAYVAGIIDGEGSICIREHIYKTPGHNIPYITKANMVELTKQRRTMKNLISKLNQTSHGITT